MSHMLTLLMTSVLATSVLLVSCGADDTTADADPDTDGGEPCEGDYMISAEEDIEALAHRSSVRGYLAIDGNGALTSLRGLENLTSVEGRLSILDNGALTSRECSSPPASSAESDTAVVSMLVHPRGLVRGIMFPRDAHAHSSCSAFHRLRGDELALHRGAHGLRAWGRIC